MSDAPAHGYHDAHARLLVASYHAVTGKALLPADMPSREWPRALFEAPYAVVSHNTAADPVFNYGNRMALELFEMAWPTFVQLPSRQSAEPVNREERQRLLARVTRDGYIDHYQGVRISASGKRFRIENATVWNVYGDDGRYRGQAAALFEWTMLPSSERKT